MMVKVLASGFYARKDISTPVKVGAISMVVNTLLCLVFIWHFEHAGLTLASALAGYVNCGTLLILLIKRGVFKPSPGWLKYSIQLLFANAAMSVYLILMGGSVQYWLSLSALMRVGLLAIHVGVAVLIYLLVLGLAGIRPAHFRGKVKE